MIPVQNVVPVRVIRCEFTPVLVPVGNIHLDRYEIWPHSVPVSCKGGTRFRSGTRWVAELTGTGSECLSTGNNAPKWLARTKAHVKLRIIPVKWLPCERGTKLDFAPEWNSYGYHVTLLAEPPSLSPAENAGRGRRKSGESEGGSASRVVSCKHPLNVREREFQLPFRASAPSRDKLRERIILRWTHGYVKETCVQIRGQGKLRCRWKDYDNGRKEKRDKKLRMENRKDNLVNRNVNLVHTVRCWCAEFETKVLFYV